MNRQIDAQFEVSEEGNPGESDARPFPTGRLQNADGPSLPAACDPFCAVHDSLGARLAESELK